MNYRYKIVEYINYLSHKTIWIVIDKNTQLSVDIDQQQARFNTSDDAEAFIRLIDKSNKLQ